MSQVRGAKMNMFFKVLVLLTFLELAFSEPIGEDCKVPENVGNVKHVLVECIGTYCQWINDFYNSDLYRAFLRLLKEISLNE